MSAAGFARFREVVLVERTLQQELLAVRDRHQFVALVVKRARDGGWDVAHDDVEEALVASRREWQERWV